jgi:hypothetical protein
MQSEKATADGALALVVPPALGEPATDGEPLLQAASMASVAVATTARIGFMPAVLRPSR